MFEKLLSPQTRSTLITDMLASPGLDNDEVEVWNEKISRSIPRDLSHALSSSLGFDPPRKAQFLSQLTKHGVVYAVSSHHAGNSCVLISKAGYASVPAQIEYIVQLPALEEIATYVAVRCYKHVKVSDPFLCFPVLQTQMWSTQLADLEIISVDCISTHFSRLLVKWEDTTVAIVTSMSRVGFLIFWIVEPSDLN
jgi:hypothetical protein